MFDLTDAKQEEIRKDWYAPIGEYVLLFSNLEFTLAEWICLLSESRALRNVANVRLKFSDQLALLFDIIEEYPTDEGTKNQWKQEWQRVQPLARTRNLICHNPPIDNFSLSLKDGHASLDARAVEVLVLKKPLGYPGSGLSLDDLKGHLDDLRQLLIRLDEFHTTESLKP